MWFWESISHNTCSADPVASGVVSESSRSFFAGFADEAVAINNEQIERNRTLDGDGLNWYG